MTSLSRLLSFDILDIVVKPCLQSTSHVESTIIKSENLLSYRESSNPSQFLQKRNFASSEVEFITDLLFRCPSYSTDRCRSIIILDPYIMS